MKILWMLVVPLADIKTLLENYVDLKMQATNMNENVINTEVAVDTFLKNQPPSNDFRNVPVALAKGEGMVYAKVSPEDYDMVMNASSKWRLCNSGYPIYVVRKEGRFITTYMHKLIHGKVSKHINADRLDNRRENLVESQRGNRGQKRKSEEDNEFELFTPRILWDEMVEFKSKDEDLKVYTGYANIDYDKKKHYSGEVMEGKPHGYGHLYEKDKCTQSCGMWEHGKMKRGMVIEYKAVPDCLCKIWKSCPLREVTKVDVVVDGVRQ